jgi:hypothetical protein
MKIGIDFDNTLVNYDFAFPKVGKEEGLLPATFAGGKLQAKDFLLRERPDGYLWEKLQGVVYGRRILAAEPYDGVLEFLAACRRSPEIETCIVSHKTILAHHDEQGTNLREAALGWLRENKLFDDIYGLGVERVYFEATRDEKARRIRALGLDVFIDDLPEVLTHPDMPADCRKFLLRGEAAGPYECAATWNDIHHALFR